MNNKLFIVLWKTPCFRADPPFAERLTALETKVRAANRFVKSAAMRMTITKPLIVFAAPEYLFFSSFNVPELASGANTTAGVDAKVGHLSAGQISTLKARLKALTSAVKDTIVIAGSTIWRDGATVRNTTFAYCNGSILLESHKSQDDGHVPGFVGTKEVASTAKSKWKKRTFSKSGVNFGLEICGDHGALTQSATIYDPVDVQFLVSAGNMLSFSDRTRFLARVGGYLVGIDAKPDAESNGVYCLAAEGMGSHGMSVRSKKVGDVWHKDNHAQSLSVGGGNVSRIGELLCSSNDPFAAHTDLSAWHAPLG